MEKKKENNTKKKVESKKTNTTKKVNKKKKNKAFTLIELLAVIIILGVLMIIAIPSVTTYISNSRKSAYVNTAKEIVSGTRNLVNEGKLEMYDPNTTYYIPVSCIKTENGSKTPYGEFETDGAYVGVTFDGNGYSYYWISNDTSGQGVKVLTPVNELDVDDIDSGIQSGEIKEIVQTTGIDGKNNILIYNSDCTGTTSGSGASSVVVYPEGKDKSTVVVGDLVKIGSEEFYVVSNDTASDKLTLLSHYNLKVGNIYDSDWTKIGEYSSSDDGYGLQSSEVKGYVDGASSWNGGVAFSSTNYWYGKVGEGLDYPGSYCSSNTYTSGTNCVYVYDSNSNLKTYVDSYKTYLEGKGATIKSARLLKVEEAFELGCNTSSWTCNSAPAFVKETSYWLGSAYSPSTRSPFFVWYVQSNGVFTYDYYNDDSQFGVRPVIVI